MSFLLLRRFLASLALLTLVIAPAAAQVFPFQLKIQEDENFFSLGNNGVFGLNAKAIGQAATIHVTATYRGLGSVELTSAPSLVAAPSFVISNIAGAPSVLFPGQSFQFDITYTPTTSTAVAGQVELIYRETLTGISAGPNPIQVVQPPGIIIMGLVGTVPEFVVSYLLTTDGNLAVLTDGSKLTFPVTPINTTTTAQISVSNRGSGPGKLTGVTVSGATFTAQGLPLFPLTIAANQQFNFGVRYSPRVVENSTGSLAISLDNSAVRVDLAGSSISNLVYRVTRGTETTTVLPNQTISLDDTSPGNSTTATIEVRNSGATDVVIGGMAVTGAGFQLGDAPILPLSLAPDAVTTLTVNFTPTLPGQFRGRLRVGNDNFDLSATGLGNRLTFSYLTGSAIVPVISGGLVVFSPLEVGKQASTQFTIRNDGTSPATIASIGIQEPGSPFTLSGQPSLPATLQPSASATFTVTFSPVSSGFTSSTLRIDGQGFTLSGSGTLPGPLPAYRITGPSGAVAPLQQPAVSLDLVSPYPVAVTGVLRLAVAPAGFSADPAVQFSTGGLTASFLIAANTTQAVFGNGSTQIRFQTGSVASTITLTPSFAIAGGVDVTPSSPTSLQLSVAAGAPVLNTILAAGQNATSFTLVITGVTTSRSLTKLDFTFTPTPQFKIATTTFSIDIRANSALWFNSSQSQSFGGQFQINIPFTFSSDQTSPPVNALDSISVIATNELGASSPLTLSLR